MSTNEVEVSHSGVFKYRLLNYYMISKVDRDSWETIKNGPGDPYGNARVIINLFDKYARMGSTSTDFLSLSRGIQIDLTERWIKESELAAKEEPDIVY